MSNQIMKNIPGQPSITALIVLLFLGSAIGVVTGHQITSNKSELLDAMSPTSKGRLANNTEQLNKLIDDLKKNESGINGNLVNKRQEISKLYLSLADILTDDLRNIQIKNPNIAASTRVTIDGLRGLSTDVMKQGVYPPFFRPQDVR